MTVTRNQIVVTNCLRVGTPSTQDLGDLFKQAKQMPGFLRINFSAAEKNASTIHFRSAHDAALALVMQCQDLDDIAFVSSSAAGRTEKSPPPLDQTANPSSVLYVRMMKGMTAEALLKIVSDLDGFDKFMNTKTFGKIYFVSAEYAMRAAERLWTETNIYSYFHHMKSDSENVTPNAKHEESCTVHVQSLDRDFDGLYKLFLELPGANRIGYHKGYIFLCFDKHIAAKSAVSRINTSTRMKARTVEFEYSPHFTPGSIGTPGKMVRMNFITTSESEVRNVFMTRPGFTKLFYTSKKCWALFSTVEHARQCVEHFNDRTNIKVVFCNKALSK
ncbi:hypothetical protein HDU79_011996 [Rhizoclosmatium sp. JEL0117]|nr:hypothetical protein HDU79_011996 [Rhizoclosmatium sp. JEL0117]